jgi:hypothetical protein
VWHGAPHRILIEQTYPGADDHRQHFDWLLRAFADDRYLRIDGKPLFLVYEPTQLPDTRRTTDLWREMAHRAGLGGLHLVGWRHYDSSWVPASDGFDACVGASLPPIWFGWDRPVAKISRYVRKRLGRPVTYQYEDVATYLLGSADLPGLRFPCVVPNWDNSPRSGVNGLVLHDSSPEKFERQLDRAIERVLNRQPEFRLVFIKSWNEWAEGNHLEPDLRFGRGYLEAVRRVVRATHV